MRSPNPQGVIDRRELIFWEVLAEHWGYRHRVWHGILSDFLREIRSASLCPAQRCPVGNRLCAHLCYAGIAYERRGIA